MNKMDDAGRFAECLLCADIAACERGDEAEDARGRCRFFRDGKESGKQVRERFSYKSENGYSGNVYHRVGTDRWSLSIFNKNGREVLHSYNSNVKSMSDLKKQVDGFPSFMRMLDRVDVLDEDDQDDDI